MKFFAFIMAFLILLLSLMPCTDGTVAMNKAKTELKTGDQHNHTTQDACSPLCCCACCGVVTTNHFVAETEAIALISKKSKISFFPSELINITLPVWQTPQLV